MRGALVAAQKSNRPALKPSSDAFIEVVAAPSQVVPTAMGSAAPEALHQIICELIAQAGGDATAGDVPDQPRLSERGDAVELRFRAGLPVGGARAKVDAYRKQCDGQLLHDDEQGSRTGRSTTARFLDFLCAFCIASAWTCNAERRAGAVILSCRTSGWSTMLRILPEMCQAQQPIPGRPPTFFVGVGRRAATPHQRVDTSPC